eukprot:TRINITY_DN22547_c0_g2_i2.p1 TRINITY_DN22547_c0_g2~~TRINITY_DN22547_c0_g2_i2.p1  ORF type:complete len:807 (+),score=141.84 TRINITY_DN22547_c0_g2_i2:148-2568(+)
MTVLVVLQALAIAFPRSTLATVQGVSAAAISSNEKGLPTFSSKSASGGAPSLVRRERLDESQLLQRTHREESSGSVSKVAVGGDGEISALVDLDTDEPPHASVDGADASDLLAPKVDVPARPVHVNQPQSQAATTVSSNRSVTEVGNRSAPGVSVERHDLMRERQAGALSSDRSAGDKQKEKGAEILPSAHSGTNSQGILTSQPHHSDQGDAARLHIGDGSTHVHGSENHVKVEQMKLAPSKHAGVDGVKQGEANQAELDIEKEMANAASTKEAQRLHALGAEHATADKLENLSEAEVAGVSKSLQASASERVREEGALHDGVLAAERAFQEKMQSQGRSKSHEIRTATAKRPPRRRFEEMPRTSRNSTWSLTKLPLPIGPFSVGSPLVRRDLPVIEDSLPLTPLNMKPNLPPLEPLSTDTGSDESQSSSESGADEYPSDGDDVGSDEDDIAEDEVASPQLRPFEEGIVSVKPPAVKPQKDFWPVPEEDSDGLRMGEGVGSMAYDRSPTASRAMNHELRRRLEVQDATTIGMLIAFFLVTLGVSFYGLYQVADDPSPVLFYSDPRGHRGRLTCSTAHADAFLHAFNLQPRTALLRIIGKRPEDESIWNYAWWGRWDDVGRRLRINASELFRVGRRPRRGGTTANAPNQRAVQFDVSLDVSPFIASNGRLESEDDFKTLQDYLRSDNPLEVVQLRKQVDFPGWEDLATNIRQRLRTLGFEGEVEVYFEAKEDLIVFRNHPFQNFVRSRVTNALMIISLVGGFLWVPYIWSRSKKVRIHSRFSVGLDIERYWEFFAEGLHPVEGFVGT